ncbi:MAG: IMP cyclohydrolase [Lachnospiraceae bacterium]|nr:IMP cyclohydrolase [Lachnospiraceae bacterium]
MRLQPLSEILAGNVYPGRGIVVGKSEDGQNAVFVYFILGRSVNSRNRVFTRTEDGIRTEAYDPSKMTDPSLIIYAPVRVYGNYTIVTNGDQTDTIYELMDKQQTFEQSLRNRSFEPDAPNYTPRISGITHIHRGEYSFAMSIIRTENGDPETCLRYTFAYEKPKPGVYRFIHTYKGDGNPLPSFEGEPEAVTVDFSGIDDLSDRIWSSLNEDNRVSLFVRLIDIDTGITESRIVNRHK